MLISVRTAILINIIDVDSWSNKYFVSHLTKNKKVTKIPSDPAPKVYI